MKNKDRLDLLEKTVVRLEQHLEVVLNRLAILEMKVNPRVPVAAPVEYPTWKPFWMNGPQYPSGAPKPYRIIPMMDTQCSLHH